ncbi:MAG TPA: YggS family pyridoxal phosphate-dependent enzyme [Planctomycetaceae bacterium]|nr:YggS family pyridoxal phosphate-dependent enzyme [Planctomycetaceae bacterium]
MSARLETLRCNLAAIHACIADACQQAGRPADAVQLVAVTKYAEMESIRALYDLGHRDFGESRPQQLVERAKQLPDDVRWHLIGHLQRNKAALVLPYVSLIHSVDSLRLIEQLDRDAARLNLSPRVLLEVNVSGEASKDGFDPDALRAAWPQLQSHVRITGLMTMAPQTDDPAAARPVFARLRALRDELATDALPLPDLSMGMSGDYPAAIAEGATIVRVGSAVFAE